MRVLFMRGKSFKKTICLNWENKVKQKMTNGIYILLCFAVIFMLVLYIPKLYKGDFIGRCIDAAYNNKTSSKIIKKGNMGDIRNERNK